MSLNRPEEDWELPDSTSADPAHAREARPDVLSRYRIILDRFGDVGGWTRDAAEELADRWGMRLTSVQDDATQVSHFLALASDVENSKPYLLANLVAAARGALERGKYGDAAKAIEVHAKVSGAIAPAGGGVTIQQVFTHAPTRGAIEAQVMGARDALLAHLELEPGDLDGAASVFDETWQRAVGEVSVRRMGAGR